jgi:hypothetical protein
VAASLRCQSIARIASSKQLQRQPQGPVCRGVVVRSPTSLLRNLQGLVGKERNDPSPTHTTGFLSNPLAPPKQGLTEPVGTGKMQCYPREAAHQVQQLPVVAYLLIAATQRIGWKNFAGIVHSCYHAPS